MRIWFHDETFSQIRQGLASIFSNFDAWIGEFPNLTSHPETTQPSPSHTNETVLDLFDISASFSPVSSQIKPETKNRVPEKIITENEDKTCMICLSKVEIGETKGLLTCKHEFHHSCITDWLQYKNNCPICRTKVFKEDTNNYLTIG